MINQQETPEQRRRRLQEEYKKLSLPSVDIPVPSAESSGTAAPLDRAQRAQAYLSEFGQPEDDFSTMRGAQRAIQQAQAENRQLIEQLLARPDVDPETRQIYEDKLVKLGGGFRRATTEDRSPLENIGRGIAAGLPKGAAYAFGDLPGAILNVPGTLIPGVPKVGQGLRDWAKEVHASVDLAIDPQGWSGAIGDLVGQMAGGSLGYGYVNAKVGAQMLRMLPKGSKLHGLVQNAMTGSVGQRVAGQAVIALPLDAFQAATLEEADLWQKLLQFGVSQGGGAIGAAVVPAAKAQFSLAEPSTVDLTPPVVSEAPAKSTMDQLNAARAAAVEHELNQKAQAQWRKANPGQKWASLSKEERQAVYGTFRRSLGKDDPTVAQMQKGVVDQQNQSLEQQFVAAPVGPPKVEATPPPAQVPPPEVTPTLRHAVDVPPASSAGNSNQLPVDLRGAKPRYAYGPKQFNLVFASDLDKALYIVAQDKKSKRDASYMAWLQKQLPDMGDAAIRALGRSVRGRIKEQARDAKPGTLNVDAGPVEPHKVEASSTPQRFRIEKDLGPDDTPDDVEMPHLQPREPVIGDVYEFNNRTFEVVQGGAGAFEFDELKHGTNTPLARWQWLADKYGPDSDAANLPTTDVMRKAQEHPDFNTRTTSLVDANEIELAAREMVHELATAPTKSVDPLDNLDKPLEWHKQNAALINDREFLEETVSMMQHIAGADAPDAVRNVILVYSSALRNFDAVSTPKSVVTAEPVPAGTTVPAKTVSGRVRAVPATDNPSPTTDTTGLRTVPTPRPLSDLTMPELKELARLVRQGMRTVGVDDAQMQLDLAHDMQLLRARAREVKAEGQAHAVAPKPMAVDVPGESFKVLVDRDGQPVLGDDGLPVRVRRDFDDPAGAQANLRPILGETRKTPEIAPVVRLAPDPKWYRAKVTRLSTEELNSHIADIEDRIATMDSVTAEGYIKRMEEARDELARRLNPPRTDGVMLHTPPEVVASAAGGSLGFLLGDTDEERMNFMGLGMLIGAGAGHTVRRFASPKVKTPPMRPGQADIERDVKPQDEIDKMQKVAPKLNRMEQIYTRILRPTWALEKLMAFAKNIPAHLNPAKLIAVFGRWSHQTDAFFYGHPFVEGPDGNPVQLTYTNDAGEVVPVKNMQQIARSVENDIRGLGNLMAALTHIEQMATKGKSNAPFSLDAALAYAQSMPESYHVAAREARKLNEALLEVLYQSGRISALDKIRMSQENWYAPLERVFGRVTDAGPIDKNKKVIPSAQLIYGRKGRSQLPIRNPFESMVFMIPRILRGAEINKAKNAIVNMRDAQPEVWDAFVSRAPKSKKSDSPEFEGKVHMLRSLIDLEPETAANLTSMFMEPIQVRGDKLSPKAYTMTVWRRGVLETYRLDDWVAYAMMSLKPEELSTMARWLGLGTDVARKGITRHPMFVGWMSFFDNFQLFMNSQDSIWKGFKIGLTWFDGLQHAFRRTGKYKELLAGGGVPTLPTAATSGALTDRLLQLKVHQGNALQSAVNAVKDLSIGDAYMELVRPFAEAGRVGEALRVRQRTGSLMEAVYQAHEIGGNFRNVAPDIRGFAHALMFLNPVLKAMDQAVFSSGLHPIRVPEVGRIRALARYGARGFLAFVLPTAYIYSKYMDDPELNELRKSEPGRRYWWGRLPGGKPIRVRKPQAEGQFFATFTEMVLDRMMENDPINTSEWLRSLREESMVSLVPVLWGTLGSLALNRDMAFGGAIVPRGVEGLESESQATQRSSEPAKWVSGFLAPVTEQPLAGEFWRRALSPAGLDFVTRQFGGMIGADALDAMSAAVRWNKTRFLEPASELPIVRRVLVDYPFSSTRSIEVFYKNLENVERVSRQLNHLAETDLSEWSQYFMRHQGEAMTIKMYMKARTDIADMRQAIEDLNHAGLPPGQMRDMRRMLTHRMIETARMTNEIAKTIMNQRPQ